MSFVNCRTVGCFKKTKEPYKLCFDCNMKDKIECIKFGCNNKTSTKYPICYTCNMLTKHPCITCKKMTDNKYLKCFTCNQKNYKKKCIVTLVEDSDDESP
jgi:hypothetical protein